MNRLLRFAAAIILLVIANTKAGAQTTTKFKASPNAITFTYTVGDTKLPASQTLSVSGGTGVSFTSVVVGGGWLTLSPASGTVPVSAKVSANPTTLPVGTYSGTITLTTTGSDQQTVTVTVELSVKAPPSTLTASPTPLTATYTRGGAAPAALTLNLTTSAAVLSYSVAIAGGTWASVTPKSGIVFPAFSTPLTVTVNPAGLAPGSYKATITVSAPQASNKTQTVTLNLTVNPGTPSLTSLWPSKITQGAGATTITVQGDNFYSGTVVKAGTTTLTTTYIGPNVVTAVLPANLLAAAAALNIIASNPGTGGGDSSARAFTVRAPGPQVDAVVNAASYVGGSIAPGEMITIFGTGLGPDTLTNFQPPTTGATIATTLSGTRVFVNSIACPVIYTSDEQVAAIVTYSAVGQTSIPVEVEYNGTRSTRTTMQVVTALPGLFTSAGTGTGQVAAFNFDEQALTYTLNSESSPVNKGSVLVLYATGEGLTTPQMADGQIVTQPTATPNPALSVQIGGADATVLYAGGIPGFVAGLMQINVRVSTSATTGKAVPVVVTIQGQNSQTGATVSVK